MVNQNLTVIRCSEKWRNFLLGRFFLICLLIISSAFIYPSCRQNQAVSSNLGSITLLGSYPNPFKTQAIIAYSIDNNDGTAVRFRIYNRSGEVIRTYSYPTNDSSTIDAFKGRSLPFMRGYSEFWWDGKTDRGDAPNGTYNVEASVWFGNEIITRDIVITRLR